MFTIESLHTWKLTHIILELLPWSLSYRRSGNDNNCKVADTHASVTPVCTCQCSV